MRDPDDFVTTENDSRRACVKSIVRLEGGGGKGEIKLFEIATFKFSKIIIDLFLLISVIQKKYEIREEFHA